MVERIALQLHTVREECKADFPGTLRKLGEMGWPAVQFAGFHDYNPAELKAVLDETGMKTAGLHVNLMQLTEQADELVAEARRFGTRDLICSNTPQDMRNEAGFREMKARLGDVARKLESEGIRISYHNHAFELEEAVGDQTALSFLLEPSEDNPLLAELDVYWLKKGGYDPASFLTPYVNRMPIIHLKDMTSDEEETFAEIGTGSIDFKPILQWCEQSGVEWYVVEQDRCRRSPLESVEISLKNLKQLLG
ncbi:sugar phosphate isomerase/epimerase [Paenibacillus sp. HB172176]|uniref:sugar phosphate isomerase/epimerase family protein n=1 Tax=Paenibacillus sp. HB172176 TaxID=2493690 RepID=UPI00143A8B39|nr:sugar phosphate isomerase/epimerase [Paenibacillus sp. HB172176]